jgi:hypothetical protein
MCSFISDNNLNIVSNLPLHDQRLKRLKIELGCPKQVGI